MVKLQRKNLWKPIDIDGALFNGNCEGLIGIEECVDYDLPALKNEIKQNALDPKSRKIKKTLKKKKKVDTLVIKEQNDNETPSKHGSTNDESFRIEELSDDLETQNLEQWNIISLPNEILKALAEQKFHRPTDIQFLTLPAAVLGKRDILGAAETGSGKTLAFGIPIVCGILKLKESSKESVEIVSDNEMDTEEISVNGEDIGCVKAMNDVEISMKPRAPLYALILTPTRELAVQVHNHLVSLCKYTDIKVAVVVGGMAMVKQERILSKGPEIIVATPGRLWELIQQGNSHLSQIESIKYLAIDETDRMLEKGHFQELHQILERVNSNETNAKDRQNFVFSATLTLIHEMPSHLKTKMKLKLKKNVKDMSPTQKLQRIVEILGITNPKIVDITKGQGISGTLTECKIACNFEEKDYYVYYFLMRHPGRTIIFCNSIGCVKRLTTLLGLLQCNPLTLHASMQQRQRLKNLDKFKEKENSVLVATDVAARGLDIPHVEHVIHYQTPRTSESYVHRSGRTARASKEGIAVLLLEPSELQNYLRLCRTLKKSEDIPTFPVQDNYLNAVKKRVQLARQLDTLDLQVKRTHSEAGWFQKAAEEMDIIVDDMSLKYDMDTARKSKKVADFKRKELAALLEKPIFPKGFSAKYPTSGDFQDLTGETTTEKAIVVMKDSIENKLQVEARRRPKSLFKPKIKVEHGPINRKDVFGYKKDRKNNRGKQKKRQQ